jgi:hypothetical protein
MGQDANSANEGDQLKHSLLAEVLGRCLDWQSLTYAETHAGAGIYLAEKQASGKPHIAKLKRTCDVTRAPNVTDAGGRYFDLHKTWWSTSSDAVTYPGSVLQAARLLRPRGETGLPTDFRVTEACEATCEALGTSVSEFGITPAHSGFQDRIDWLTANDSLVMLIDPFTYADDNRALNRGQIDLETLTRVIGHCWHKSRCVVGFWCAVADSTAWAKRERFRHSLRHLANANDASCRVFSYGRFSNTWIGVGEGQFLVNDIPDMGKWKKSWLKRVVKEEIE